MQKNKTAAGVKKLSVAKAAPGHGRKPRDAAGKSAPASALVDPGPAAAPTPPPAEPLATLRRRAEKQLCSRMALLDELSKQDARKLVQELGTLQIELEMQNEELRRAQIELEQSRQQYVDLYDLAPVGYFSLDPQGAISMANLTGAAMLAINRQELLRKPFVLFVHPEDRDQFYLHTQGLREGARRRSCELRLLRGDGSCFHVRLESTAVRAGNYALLAIHTTVIDISEGKEAELALAESEARFRRIAETSADAIFQLDPRGVITYSSQAMDAFGPTPEEALGQPFAKFLPPEELPKAMAAFARLNAGEKIKLFELKALKTDGSLADLEINATPIIREDGTIAGIQGIARDITARKQTEEVLQRQSQELAGINRELEDFSFTVSHDLRAPLRVIEGFTDAIIEDYGDALPEPARDYFTRVVAASRRMDQLITAMLDMARLTKREIKENTVNLTSMVEVAAHELDQLNPERRVRCYVAGGVKVRGDFDLLRIVIENLMSNAWKFTAKTEKARIEFGVLKVVQASGVQGSGFRVQRFRVANFEPGTGNPDKVYYIRDNGAGFDMTYADKLFSPFRRMHSEADFPGLGIGLATVKKIITRHGGRIWAEAEPGKGATFYFTLAVAGGGVMIS